MPLDYIVFCDTGMEYPQMYEHIDKLEEYIGREITRLQPTHSYEFYLEKWIKKRGKNKGTAGYGHPTPKNRWCTAMLKAQPFRDFIRGFKEEVVDYHGIALDELRRTQGKPLPWREVRYPLVHMRMTEADCLKYCYEKGFDWGGLYHEMRRASCWCCPMSSINDLRNLYNNFPELWGKLRELDDKAYNRFRNEYSLDDLHKRFQEEGRIIQTFDQY